MSDEFRNEFENETADNASAQPEQAQEPADVSFSAQVTDTAPEESVADTTAEATPDATAEATPEQDIPYVQAERTDADRTNRGAYGYGAQGYGRNYGHSANPYGYYTGTTNTNTTGTPSGAPAFQPVQTPETKSAKKGKKTFLAIVAVILVFALGVGTSAIINKKGGIKNIIKSVSGNSSEVSTTMPEKVLDSKTKLEISETPTSSESSTGSTLTAAQIAEKVRASNVGIVVYSGNSTQSAGEGSGIVMSLDSTGKYTYIVTCAHVIDDSGVSIKVQTEDGTSYDAAVVGYDTRTDVGVLSVETTDLQLAEFGDSSALSIGDPVYAVGNPGGVEFFGSFTGGYVSAINRPVSSEIGYTMECIQHDASINPGNSGGMLVNQYGQVVGINSQKIADTSYEGMGFAIPISSAKEIIDSLIQYGYVPNRPKLGITYYPVTASTQYNMIAQLKGLPAGTLIINEISSDSSLADTDARQYDMIIAVDGKDLDTADVLLELIDDGKVGDKFTLTLCRVENNYNLKEFDVEVTLVEDKGEAEEETTEAYVNPFDSFGYGGY